MPTNLKVIRTKQKNRVRVSVGFEFSPDDPQAMKIYNGIGLCLREALTEDEAREFLRKLEVERKKLSA